MDSNSKGVGDLSLELKQLREQIDQARGQVSRQPTESPPTWWSTENAMTVSVLVLGFGVLSMLISAYLLKCGKGEDAVLRVVGTIVVLFAAVFLVVAGYSDKQIAPVMGLLGTIAGYLLGKGSKQEEKSSSN